MIVYTLWHRSDDDDAPWIVDAVDEYTLDNNGEFPPEYLQALRKLDGAPRIIHCHHNIPWLDCRICSKPRNKP